MPDLFLGFPTKFSLFLFKMLAVWKLSFFPMDIFQNRVCFFQVDPSDIDNYTRMIELYFQFCMIWSFCCSVDEDGRKKIDNYIRELEGTFPNKDMIYEYFVDHKNKTWMHWEDKLRSGWKFSPT